MSFKNIYLLLFFFISYLPLTGQNICPVSVRLQIPPNINSKFNIEIIDFYTNDILLKDTLVNNFQQYLFKLDSNEPRWCILLLKNKKDSILARIGDFLISDTLVQIEINGLSFRNPITGGENDFINKHRILLFEIPAKISKHPSYSSTKLQAYQNYPSANDGDLYEYYKEYEQNVLETVSIHNNSYFVLSKVLENSEYFSIPLLDKCSLTFSKSLMQTKLGKKLLEKIENYKKLMIGQIIPNAKILSINDISSDFISNYKNQKFTLIDFWASWCVPCIKNIHELQKKYSSFDTSKFDILLVSIDRDKKDWLAASKKEKIFLKNYIDQFYLEGRINNSFNINYIPHNILIDKQGKILATNISDEELNEFLIKEKLMSR